MQFEPRTYSPFEPGYLRHYRLMPNGHIEWAVEVDEPRRYVDGGIEPTIREANAAIDKAIEKDMKQIAESFGL